MVRATKGKKKSSKVVSFDFTGVEAGGRMVPDGTYSVTIDEIGTEEGQSGYDYWAVRFKVTAGQYKGSVLFDNLSHSPAALFKIKRLLEVLGVEAEGMVDIDPDELVGQELDVLVVNENFEGKDRPKVQEYMALSTTSEEEEEEEEEEVVVKKKVLVKKK